MEFYFYQLLPSKIKISLNCTWENTYDTDEAENENYND